MDPLNYPLGSLGLQIQAHWKRHRPTMYRELETSGKLLESVYAAQELTNDLMDELLAERMPHHQAWELAREEWAFLPSERDEPSLSFDPTTLFEQTSEESRASVRQSERG